MSEFTGDFWYKHRDMPHPLKRFARVNGSGSTNLAVDGSVTPVDCQVVPQSGSVWLINRALIYLEDSGPGFSATNFGTISALSNGVSFHWDHYHRQAGIREEVDLTDAYPITQNSIWSSHCYDLAIIDWGVGANSLAARWTFARGGSPILLNGDYGDHIGVRINDDISGVDLFTVKMDGIVLIGTDDYVDDGT